MDGYVSLNVRITRELDQRLKELYRTPRSEGRGVAGAVERLLREAVDLPPIAERPQGGRFTSDRNPGKKKTEPT